jgi:RHS repeat-associated protein
LLNLKVFRKLLVTAKFNTQELDQTGLSYFNARYHDSDTGRFISPDPTVPDPTSTLHYNRYMFVAGNPIMLQDISGYADTPAAGNKTIEKTTGGSENDTDGEDTTNTTTNQTETEQQTNQQNNQPESSERSQVPTSSTETSSQNQNTDEVNNQNQQEDNFYIRITTLAFKPKKENDKITKKPGEFESKSQTSTYDPEKPIQTENDAISASREQAKKSTGTREVTDPEEQKTVIDQLSNDSIEKPHRTMVFGNYRGVEIEGSRNEYMGSPSESSVIIYVVYQIYKKD